MTAMKIRNNQVICKFDLVRFTKDTVAQAKFGTGEYAMIQMIKLRLKNPTEYREINRWEYSSRLAFEGTQLQFPVPLGAELKFHDVRNPTYARSMFRNPDLVAAKILGLDLTNKEERKAAKSIGQRMPKI